MNAWIAFFLGLVLGELQEGCAGGAGALASMHSQEGDVNGRD